MDIKEVKMMYKQTDVELTILFDSTMPEYILLHGERVRHYNPKELEQWIKMLLLIDAIIGPDKRLELQDKLLEEWYTNEISKKLKEREQFTSKNIMEMNYYEKSCYKISEQYGTDSAVSR